MPANPENAIAELTEGDGYKRFVTDQIKNAARGRGQVDSDDLVAGSTINSLMLVAVIIAVASELGPEFVGKLQKILANLNKSIGGNLRTELSPGAAEALVKATASANEILDEIKADVARVPDQLVALGGRQEVTEILLTMVTVALHPRLDTLVDTLASMRKVAAEAKPPRHEAVEAYDSYLSTLRMVQDGTPQRAGLARQAS